MNSRHRFSQSLIPIPDQGWSQGGEDWGCEAHWRVRWAAEDEPTQRGPWYGIGITTVDCEHCGI